MAVLHNKEEKIQAVLGRLTKDYTADEFVSMFINLYSKDWGKIKSAYIKASQDKEPGTVINMPKPDLYLKQLLETYKNQSNTVNSEAISKQIEGTLEEREATKVENKPSKLKTPKTVVDKTEEKAEKAKKVKVLKTESTSEKTDVKTKAKKSDSVNAKIKK